MAKIVLFQRPDDPDDAAPPRRLAGLAAGDWLFVLWIAAISILAAVVMDHALNGAAAQPGSTFVIALVVAVPVALVIARQRAEITARNRQLRDLLRRDMLTGALTRRSFLEALERGAAVGGTLVLIDADHFKAVNDRWGHSAGDAVLAEITARMGRAAGPAAVLGRLGGEEFGLFLPGVDPPEAAGIAESVRAAVGDSPVLHQGTSITCTISLGLAPLPARERRLAAVIHAADMALYRAKSKGRNRICHAGPADDLERRVG